MTWHVYNFETLECLYNPSKLGKSYMDLRHDPNYRINRRHSTGFDQPTFVANSGSVERRALSCCLQSVGVSVASTVDPTEDFPFWLCDGRASVTLQCLETKATVAEELFQVRDATECATQLESPRKHWYLLIDKFVSKMDVKKYVVKEMFEIRSREVLPQRWSFWGDIFANVPTAYAVIARLHVATKLSNGAVGWLAVSTAYEGDPLVPPSENYGSTIRDCARKNSICSPLCSRMCLCRRCLSCLEFLIGLCDLSPLLLVLPTTCSASIHRDFTSMHLQGRGIFILCRALSWA